MLEFMEKLGANPYYPVLPQDYPGLFDFRITKNGAVYMVRLGEEWDEGTDLPGAKLLHLGMLYLAYAVSLKSPRECRMWQAYMFTIGETAGPFMPEIETDLTQMGCIEENPLYDPRLYKSHLMWKREMLGEIDSM